MTKLPKEAEAFSEAMVERFRKALHTDNVQATGPLELLVDGERVELEDLHRALRQEEKPESVVCRFIEAFMASRRLMDTPLPYDVVKSKILPLIRPLERLRGTKPGFLAAQPFINDTVILYMIDINGAATPLSTEQLIHWGVEVDEIDRMARNNLAEFRPELELQLYQNGESSAAMFNTGDGYDASRLLLDRLYPKLAPELGGNFLVAIPTRDVFIAFPTEHEPFIRRLRSRIDDDYQHLPYPITSDLFLVTLDGVAPWREAA